MKDRLSKLIAEIDSIIEDAGEQPVPRDAPADAGTKKIVALAKLDAAKDLLAIAARDL